VMFGVILWQMGNLKRPRLRMQFFLTYVLLWALLGNVAATLLSSVGPVYYGRLTGLSDPFAPLMDYLHAANEVVPVLALNVQDMLWKSYSENGLAIIGGITAMPSMHIATSTSFALVAFATDRRLGYLFAAFAVIIQIGSVHLGLHYAIDGYAAAIGTCLIWLAVGWLLRQRIVMRLLGDTDADSSPRVQAGWSRGASIDGSPRPTGA
jgi:PAP2 superfamily